jgi:phosphoribosylamine--glycine ligase
MITDHGPKVLEFNSRFGDPECQPVMTRLNVDLVPLLEATIEGKLDQAEARWNADASVCVVLCSRGYPGTYETGKEIRGLENLENWKRGVVFHSGTARHGNRWVTSGGRVLGVTALGNTIEEAVQEAYHAVDGITWDGMHCRKDIAHRALSSQGL